jgi:DNA-directed RNA polymerase subunit K/omega
MSDEEESDIDVELESTGSNDSDVPDEAPIEEFVREDEDEDVEAPPSILEAPPSLIHMHPQERRVGYDEVLSKCTLQRNEHNQIVDPLHTTLPFLTKYEYSRVVGMRAEQLENGAASFIPVEDSVHDPYVIAKEEVRQKKIPFILMRPLPHGNIEYWKLSDLDILV